MQKTFLNARGTLEIKLILASIVVGDPGFLAIKKFLLSKACLDLEDCIRVMISLEYARSNLERKSLIDDKQSKDIQKVVDTIRDCFVRDYLISDGCF